MQSFPHSITHPLTHWPTHWLIHHLTHTISLTNHQLHSPNHSINNAIICRCTQKHNHSVLHKNVLMSVLHTRPYEITKFSDICNFIYSLNQSHSRSFTFLFTRSPSHNSHQSHNLSHSPNHSINDAIIRRCTQTHNHSVCPSHKALWNY